MNIHEIKNLTHGSTVDAATGVLSEVGQVKTFTNKLDGSRFTSQSAKLSLDGSFMFIEFSNMSDVTCCDGREIELKSVTSVHGTQGVTVKDSQRGDRTFKNLRVTPSAKFMVGEVKQEPAAPSKRQALKAKQSKSK